jgi:hypothetical protein
MSPVLGHAAGLTMMGFAIRGFYLAARQPAEVTLLERIAYSMMLMTGLMDTFFLVKVIAFGSSAQLGRRDPTWFGEFMWAMFFLPILPLERVDTPSKALVAAVAIKRCSSGKHRTGTGASHSGACAVSVRSTRCLFDAALTLSRSVT